MTAPPPRSAPDNGVSPHAAVPSDRPAMLVVRRDVRRDLRSSMILLGAAVLLVFWIPAVIVMVRPEAAYFTNGILWSALIATIVVLLLGAGGTLWWSRRGKVLLTADSEGVRLPARRRRPALQARWEDLALIRLVGATDPALAFYLREPNSDEPDDETHELDLSEPELLRPLDFVADPPPAMRAPNRSTFEQITPLPHEEEPEHAEPVASKPARGEALHATGHVVPLARTRPPLIDILRAITRLSAGRVRLD